MIALVERVLGRRLSLYPEQPAESQSTAVGVPKGVARAELGVGWHAKAKEPAALGEDPEPRWASRCPGAARPGRAAATCHRRQAGS